jgi:hypothetical protein
MADCLADNFFTADGGSRRWPIAWQVTPDATAAPAAPAFLAAPNQIDSQASMPERRHIAPQSMEALACTNCVSSIVFRGVFVLLCWACFSDGVFILIAGNMGPLSPWMMIDVVFCLFWGESAPNGQDHLPFQIGITNSSGSDWPPAFRELRAKAFCIRTFRDYRSKMDILH